MDPTNSSADGNDDTRTDSRTSDDPFGDRISVVQEPPRGSIIPDDPRLAAVQIALIAHNGAMSMNREAGAQIFDLRDVPAAFIAALEHQNPAFTVVPMNLEKELDLETFMNGLDSHWHSPESRRSWCRMFFADMQRRGGAIRG